MTTGICFKDQVVRNCLSFLFAFVFLTAFSQPAASRKTISFSIDRASLHEVIDQLSLATGLHFIYSSDKIKSNGPFSLDIVNKSVREALSVAGTQMNLEFKQQGAYVIIKAKAHAPLLAKATGGAQPERSIQATASLTTFFPATQPVTIRAVNFLQPDSISRLHKYMKQWQPYFDSTWLKRIPVQYVNKLNRNNKHWGWFVAAGTMFNDYSSGMELQAGVRAVYAVFNPSWMQGNQFHGAYGMGTSILIGRNFSINPVYTYANVNWKFPDEFAKASLRQPAYRLTIATHHHQFKLMMKYSVTSFLQLQAGPTFNRAYTRYRFTEADRAFFRTWTPEMALALPTNSYHSATPGAAMEVYAIRPSSYQSVKSWIGYEASILVRINFK